MNGEPLTIPAALTAVLTTGVGLFAILNPSIGQAAQIAIIAFGNSVIVLGSLLYGRARVTPVAAPRVPIGTRVEVITPDPTEANPIVTL